MIYRVSGKVVLSSAAHFFWNFFNETNLRVLTISHPQVQSVTEMVVVELVGLITNICATNGDQTKSPVYCLSIVYTHHSSFSFLLLSMYICMCVCLTIREMFPLLSPITPFPQYIPTNRDQRHFFWCFTESLVSLFTNYSINKDKKWATGWPPDDAATQRGGCNT